jgi:hypothetical protein
MAKKKVLRKKRIQAQKKPQPLPKSVQALLRYLGGSDVKIASSARQPAMVAQQFAPQQQQQQQFQQAPPPLQARRQQPVGQTIAASPLARLAPPPQPPQPTPMAQAPIIIKQSKKEAPTPSSSDVLALRSKVGLLEQGLSSFKQQAGQVAVALSEGIRKSLKASKHYQEQDYDPLDSEVEMYPAAKPYVAEQGLQVNTALSDIFALRLQRAASAPTRASAAYEPEELEAGQGAYASSQYIKAVASPEMTPKVTLKGRPRLSEQQKAANAAARKEEKAQRKQLLKTAGETLYQEGQSATKALETLTSTIAVKKKIKLVPKVESKLEAMMSGADPSTQVQFLASAGGAAAQPTQQRGKTVLEMMGGGAAKK